MPVERMEGEKGYRVTPPEAIGILYQLYRGNIERAANLAHSAVDASEDQKVSEIIIDGTDAIIYVGPPPLLPLHSLPT